MLSIEPQPQPLQDNYHYNDDAKIWRGSAIPSKNLGTSIPFQCLLWSLSLTMELYVPNLAQPNH